MVRIDSSSVGPYSQVSIETTTPNLGEAKLAQLRKLDDTRIAWLNQVELQVQRPLYIGITVNLASRMNSHMTPGSRLRGYMDAAGVDISECGLRYYTPPYSITGEAEDKDEEGVADAIGDADPVPNDVRALLRLSLDPPIRIRLGGEG